MYVLLCGPQLHIPINSYEDKYPTFKLPINSYEDKYPTFKQEAAKKAGQLQGVLVGVKVNTVL